MSRVFIIDRPKNHINLSLAEEYGEVQLVFDSNDRRSSIFKHEAFQTDVINRLQELEYDPQKDFIAIVGNLLNNVIGMLAIVLCYGEVNTLFYHAGEGCYLKKVLKGHSNDEANSSVSESLPASQRDI